MGVLLYYKPRAVVGREVCVAHQTAESFAAGWLRMCCAWQRDALRFWWGL